MTTLRICFVGDSLVNGTNDPRFLGWPGRLAQNEVAAGHDVTVYNLGIRAETSEMIAARWQKECQPRLPEPHPAALVFSFGINDIALENGVRRVSQDRSLEVAHDLMTAATSWLPTLWVGPPPVEQEEVYFDTSPEVRYQFSRDDIAELNRAYVKLAADLQVPYFDLFTALERSPEWKRSFDSTDSVHPLDGGYALISNQLKPWSAWRAWFDDEKST